MYDLWVRDGRSVRCWNIRVASDLWTCMASLVIGVRWRWSLGFVISAPGDSVFCRGLLMQSGTEKSQL